MRRKLQQMGGWKSLAGLPGTHDDSLQCPGECPGRQFQFLPCECLSHHIGQGGAKPGSPDNLLVHSEGDVLVLVKVVYLGREAPIPWALLLS